MSKEYQIQFEPMSLGTHHLEFSVDHDLFRKWGNEDLLSADIIVDVDLNKTANMLDLRFKFEGQFQLPCDRCNESLFVPLQEEGKLIVKYGQVSHEEMDDLIILGDNEHVVDLESYLYESISLMIPRRNVHSEEDCDPEVLKMLKEKEEETKDKIDPRWENLRDKTF